MSPVPARVVDQTAVAPVTVTKEQADDVRVTGYDPVIPPALLLHELPQPAHSRATVLAARAAVAGILQGRDDRLLVIVGPCSVHDVAAALEYARKLVQVRDALKADLEIVMRCYAEKPRTRVGWKGLINDPHLNDTFAINTGLRTWRSFLLQVTALGLPAGAELLDPISPQWFSDLLSWGSIGARTAESPLHRELASGCSFAVGIKNATDGRVSAAVDAVVSARAPHRFLGVTKEGNAAIAKTTGNALAHVVLRGGSATGANYAAEHVARARDALLAAGVPESVARVIVDCSHGNSNKDPTKQPLVARDVASQIVSGSRAVAGVMLESFLVAGRQDIDPRNPQALVYGQSVTDACLGWEETMAVLEELAAAVRARRANASG